MPLFRRRPTEAAPPPPPPVGTLSCSEQGCNNATAITCAYRDRRSRPCPMAFCPDHWSMVGERVYCRRHASTIVALGRNTEAGAMPDLENRGPSLVNFVASKIGPEVEALLRAAAHPGETVQSESEVSAMLDHERRRRWGRSWKLLEPTGLSLKVSLSVTEGEDEAHIDVRVNSNVVARGVPPWIARRRAGVRVDSQVDADQRDLFHRFLINQIAEAVAKQRSGHDSLTP
jgi:hypothetical protein